MSDTTQDVADRARRNVQSLLDLQKQIEKIGRSLTAKEEAAHLAKYPGKPYKDTKDTYFADLLRRQCLAVVKCSYFHGRMAEGMPFQDRASIAPEHFIPGEEVLRSWTKYGAKFLVIISYAWLDKDHPDPHRYHLERLTRCLAALKGYHGPGHYPNMYLDLGIILDFCSLWQKGSGDDKRTPFMVCQFKEGLTEINTPYSHQEVTAIKLMAVPSTVTRKYEDRGWTLFESVLIDGKEPSEIIGLMGEHNVMTLADDFDLDTPIVGKVFVAKCATAQRQPPCTPERFAQQMQSRGESAIQKGVKLFTNGKDQPFLLKTYHKAFLQQVRAEKLDYTEMNWGDDEAEALAEVLYHCKDLVELWLGENHIGDAGAAKLAAALPSLASLKKLFLAYNQIGDAGAAKIAAALPSMASLKEIWLHKNQIGDVGAEQIAAAMPRMASLKILRLGDNQIGDAGAGQIAAALPSMASLERLSLGGNKIGADGEKQLKAAKLPSLRELYV